MDAFSYLSVLLSIILGLGFTQLFAALGRLVRHRDRVRTHWLPLLWAAVLLLIYVQVWWSMYGLRLHRDWTFLAFSVLLAQAAALDLMAALVLPELVDEAGVDLGDYFDAQHRWFFSFFLVLLGISIAKDLILSGHWPDPTNLGFHGAFAAVCLAGLVVRGRTAQGVLAVSAAVVVVAYIGLLFAHLR